MRELDSEEKKQILAEIEKQADACRHHDGGYTFFKEGALWVMDHFHIFPIEKPKCMHNFPAGRFDSTIHYCRFDAEKGGDIFSCSVCGEEKIFKPVS